jgi:signal transduction histidine kinase/ActR/RegA family two-component response regulator
VSGIPLRRRLVVLTAAGILPLALLAGLSLFALQAQQQAQAERVGLELARSVANAIDAELRKAVSILETLATTPTLDRDDLSGFRDRARRVLDSRPAWAGIVLTDPAGTPLVDTRSAEGSALLPVAERESFRRLVETRAPTVGSLTRHAEKHWLFAVRVPVMRGARVRHVLTALVTPESVREVLNRQRLPDDWVISVVDANGLRVARSRAHEETLGGRLTESAQRVVSGARVEGVGLSTTLEGERIFTPYARVESSGWTAVLGMPTTLVEAAAARSLAFYSTGLLLSIAAGTLAAQWVARTITRPIGQLRGAAEALGRKQVQKFPATSIQEIREVGAALEAAAQELAAGEAEREDLLRKERRAREAAESADRAKDEFMAVLSHELRTPLNAVYGWARMLQSGQLRDQATTVRAVDAIVRNADVQVQLIDDLLDLSRISSGKMRLDVRRVDTQAVLQAALDAVRPAAEAKTIRIHPTLDPDAGVVIGDPGRLQQVAWNLLMNAIKFTPAGGTVHVGLQRIHSSLSLTISDTGRGIAPDMLPHVFERFRQADSSSTRAHGGLGLGLALVKHLVELHGGTVSAQSDGEGLGATFTVTLPIAVADAPAHRVPQAPVGAAAVAPPMQTVRLDGIRVLVTDDDREGLALAEAILTRVGAEVRTCRSAEETLHLLTEWRPDVLVSDIEMPGEDGYSLIRKVRALGTDEGSGTPAIALTAYGRPQDRLRALAAGFNMHVPKPVDPGELTTIIADLVGTPEQPQAS